MFLKFEEKFEEKSKFLVTSQEHELLAIAKETRVQLQEAQLQEAQLQEVQTQGLEQEELQTPEVTYEY